MDAGPMPPAGTAVAQSSAREVRTVAGTAPGHAGLTARTAAVALVTLVERPAAAGQRASGEKAAS
ncbi:hypothetical protein ACQPYK_20910 [Streptosporangium sp. CA-135522]|uniref:hypothetical protein n=1 Tax=Streptosporangium sp. CA-135522 TaxID=3240072 RepID=UPI003D921142